MCLLLFPLRKLVEEANHDSLPSTVGKVALSQMLDPVIIFQELFRSMLRGLLSSQLLTNLLGTEDKLWVSFGWNTLLNLFYMPGCILGASTSDWWGPRNALGYKGVLPCAV